jgi:hypothetical protein
VGTIKPPADRKIGIMVYLRPDQLEGLAIVCSDTGLDRTEVIRRLIDAELKTYNFVKQNYGVVPVGQLPAKRRLGSASWKEPKPL